MVHQQEEQRRSDGITRVRHSPDLQVDPQQWGRFYDKFGYQLGIRISEVCGYHQHLMQGELAEPDGAFMVTYWMPNYMAMLFS